MNNETPWIAVKTDELVGLNGVFAYYKIERAPAGHEHYIGLETNEAGVLAVAHGSGPVTFNDGDTQWREHHA